MVSYIDEHKGRFGVEPICKVLPIAPSTYYTHRSLQQDPERRSARAKRDNDLITALVCRNNKSTRYAAPLQSLKHQFQLYLVE